MKTTKTLLFAGIFVFAAPLAVLADDAPGGGGPTIDGATEVTVASEGSIDASVGSESSSDQEEFAVDSGKVTGDLTVTGDVDGAIDASVGNESCSQQKIGTIGAKDACK